MNPEFYPEFNDRLKPSMRLETQHFFAEILRHDLSALNLLDSDFAMLNYPLVLAGGSKLGLRHGRFLKLGERMPLSNVFMTMLNRLEVPVESFADSSGECSELTV